MACSVGRALFPAESEYTFMDQHNDIEDSPHPGSGDGFHPRLVHDMRYDVAYRFVGQVNRYLVGDDIWVLDGT